MSLSMMAADSVDRQMRRYGVSADPKQTAMVAGATPASGTAGSGASITGALTAIEKFVPTEIVGIYVAVAAILIPIVGKSAPIPAAAGWLAACLVLTPVYYWINYATQWKRRTGSLPRPMDVPLWPMLAASVAFVVWGLAVSQLVSTPLLCRALEPSSAECTGRLQVSTVLVLVIGPLLGAIDNLVNAKKADASGQHGGIAS